MAELIRRLFIVRRRSVTYRSDRVSDGRVKSGQVGSSDGSKV